MKEERPSYPKNYVKAEACSLQVDTPAVEGAVMEMMECLAGSTLFDCQKAMESITRVGMQSNYVGVLHTLSKDSQASLSACFKRFVYCCSGPMYE